MFRYTINPSTFIQKPLLLPYDSHTGFHIPDELEPALQQVPGDVEQFIVEAVRKQLALPVQAEDGDSEASAAVDAGNEFLLPEEVQY